MEGEGEVIPLVVQALFTVLLDSVPGGLAMGALAHMTTGAFR